MSRPGSGSCLRAVGIAGLVGIWSLAIAGGVEERWIRERVAALDHESFPERQRASAALLEAGVEAVPILTEALRSDSPEQRARVTEVIEFINGRRLQREFKELGKLADDAIDVEHGMWLISLILDPEVTRESIDERIDTIAGAVGKRIGEADIAAISPLQIAEAVANVLRDEIGLGGDHDSYDHPDNSSVHRTLQQKNGLPIVLSEIAVAAARRLDLPVVGIPVPGRYMIMCGGDPNPSNNVIVDPHENWRFRERAEVARQWRIRGLPDGYLTPSPPRKILVRMLSNLQSDLLDVGNARQAKALASYKSLMEGDDR